jgi:hypothetical protein
MYRPPLAPSSPPACPVDLPFGYSAGGHGVLHEQVDDLALADVDDLLRPHLVGLRAPDPVLAAQDPEVHQVDVQLSMPWWFAYQ